MANSTNNPKHDMGEGKPNMQEKSPGPLPNRDKKDGGRAREFLSDMQDSKSRAK